MRGGLTFRRISSLAIAFGVVPVVLALFSSPAFAAVTPVTAAGFCGGNLTVGGVLACMVENTQESQGIFPALCYLFGLVIGIWSIAKLYEHVQSPQQVSVWEPIKRALCAGCLFALPMVMEVVYNTLTDGANVGLQVDGWTGSPTGGGLDAMVVALMNDAFNPFRNLIFMFCYFAGAVLVIIGIMRLLKSAQEGPRGPGGFGTIMTFLVAGALFSAQEMMASWSFSLFMTNDVAVASQLNFDAGLENLEKQHIMSVISAILAFVMVLGWISFVRGWFIIRDVAEGNSQASLMAGMTHLFGGALAINLGPVLNAVQETFGLSAIGVNFN